MATRAIEAGRAFMRLSINDEAFRSGLQRVEARLKKAGQAITNVGARLGAFGAALGAPLLAAVKAASDAQETFSKFEVVFGAQADAVRQWGDTLAEQVGRSRTEVAGFVAGFALSFVVSPGGWGRAVARMRAR